MERVSRIYMNSNSSRKLAGKLLSLGIKLKEPKIPETGTVFFVSDNDPNFSEVMRIVKDNNLSILLEAKFSSRDYQIASHFTLFGMPKTFPSPSDGFLDRTTTYDTRNACRACGVGLKQIAFVLNGR